MKDKFKEKEAYTITLYDMDLREGNYVHRYKIFEPKEGSKVNIETTDWTTVDDDFFLLHVDNLGMEIFSKNRDGLYNNLVTPPGFSHFVGHDKYGQWSSLSTTQSTDSSRVWRFHESNGESVLERELGLAGLNITKGEYDRFLDKYQLNRPFYGDQIAKDSTKYGTSSRHWFLMRPMFYTRRLTKKNFDKPYRGSYSSSTRGGGGFGK
ncbi:hypothetical protein [Crocinitomix catalasitica]|uniref:hypothetical protein n=1 Tax=Crocinitomix catalasitica TaxID=184607 RepID=UPI001B80E297|nr:hypothetical protein [Crocinitomix catalasitica]